MSAQGRPPTEAQFESLLVFGGGAMLVSGADRRLKALIRRGWLAPDRPQDPFNGLRITADGCRAIAAGIERYGLPEIRPTKRRPEPPVVVRLRQERDDARSQRDQANRELSRARVVLARARRALEDTDA